MFGHGSSRHIQLRPQRQNTQPHFNRARRDHALDPHAGFLMQNQLDLRMPVLEGLEHLYDRVAVLELHEPLAASPACSAKLPALVPAPLCRNRSVAIDGDRGSARAHPVHLPTASPSC
uniref:Transposase n=1 Tax=Steinernema glaseri TaxID=37863 RepID=A0A1I8APP3_9BILA